MNAYSGDDYSGSSTGDTDEDQPNWQVPCCVCGAKPTVGDTDLCGVCCWGSDGVDWWIEEPETKRPA